MNSVKFIEGLFSGEIKEGIITKESVLEHVNNLLDYRYYDKRDFTREVKHAEINFIKRYLEQEEVK